MFDGRIAQVDEWQLARESLMLAGVAGAEDFGWFVNDARYWQLSAFDERAAMPVLLELLPTLTDPRLSPRWLLICGGRGRGRPRSARW
jgi:hypothetical protein